MEFLSELLAVAAVRAPATQANTAGTTNAIDMARFSEAMLILLLGDMAAETIDFSVQAAAAEGGPWTDMPGKVATQLAAHATNNDGDIIVICVKDEELTGTQRFIRGRAVTGGATGGPAAIVGLARSKIKPSSADDLANVVQIIQ
jgi:hypothetical protein